MRILSARISLLAGKIRNFNSYYLQQVQRKNKKKTAHAYFKRPYFSKSFGGKIKPGQTDVNKETTFTKKIDIINVAKD